MPILTYAPDGGGDPSRFEFAFDDLEFDEIIALEKLTGRNWGDIETLYWGNNFEVQGKLLLVLMRRAEPNLTMGQLKLKPRQLAFDVIAAERAAFLQQLLQLPDLSVEQRAAVEIVQQAGETPDADADLGDFEGKA